ncbi:hypothetical protein FRC19_003867 [Serendipita sp. 401]|nr:hypothetical protein FRC19_003867 [Serendipita sp. 401]KAG8865780.1 hypothetical protein FRC20_009495 [Serendipita sp. 405]
MNTACASFLQPYPAYYYLGASDIMSGGGWPTTSYHEEPQLDTTCWSVYTTLSSLLEPGADDNSSETNDWNTLGKYPFATKIRLGGEEFPIEQIIPMPMPFPTASIQIATHSRQRSQSHSADSERTEEPVTSPQDDGTMSPMSPPEGLVGSHIELIKLPSGQWQCPHCSKQFRRRDRGQAHVNVHINTRPYRCEGACGNPIW